jgi:DNA-binding transcriptional MerR regulator
MTDDALTTDELCAATGATRRQVQLWRDKGVLKPTLLQGRAWYDSRDAYLARLAAQLSQRGIGFNVRRRILAAVDRHQAPRPPYYIVTWDEHVRFVTTTDRVLALVKAAPSSVVVVEVVLARTPAGGGTNGDHR